MIYGFDPTEAVAHLTEAERDRLLTRRNLPEPVPGPGELTCSPGFWQGRRVLVTGSRGFLGTHVERRLRALGCRAIIVPELAGYDLLQQEQVRRLFREARPEIVLHLAEQVGGIGANQRNPGRFYYVNLLMGTLLIEEARQAGVAKFVQMGSICSYPRFTPVPFREEDFWNGYPDASNAPYGIAKKALLVQLQAYREQYGFNGIYLLPVNLYGPGDDFDLQRSYVIPALVRKTVDARDQGADHVEVWGSGVASREFLYVDDCARAILLAAEHYEGSDPVNLGTGEEVKIRELAQLISRVVGFGGELRFDPGRPDGQPRRRMDTRRALQLFGFRAHVSLEAGLRETVHWYEEHRTEATAATWAAPAHG